MRSLGIFVFLRPARVENGLFQNQKWFEGVNKKLRGYKEPTYRFNHSPVILKLNLLVLLSPLYFIQIDIHKYKMYLLEHDTFLHTLIHTLTHTEWTRNKKRMSEEYFESFSTIPYFHSLTQDMRSDHPAFLFSPSLPLSLMLMDRSPLSVSVLYYIP